VTFVALAQEIQIFPVGLGLDRKAIVLRIRVPSFHCSILKAELKISSNSAPWTTHYYARMEGSEGICFSVFSDDENSDSGCIASDTSKKHYVGMCLLSRKFRHGRPWYGERELVLE